MRLMRFTAGVAMAALVAGSAIAQTAPAGQAAGTLDPAAEQAPATAAAAEPEFTLADGIVATVNDQIITGFDLRGPGPIRLPQRAIRLSAELAGAAQLELGCQDLAAPGGRLHDSPVAGWA